MPPFFNGYIDMTDNIECITDENGTKYWYLNGKLHREDRPAVEYANGAKYWYINGKKYTFSEWCELTDKSYEEKCELVFNYG